MMKINKLNNNNHKAFSLAESIISMMLLVLVVMLTLSSITRKKTNFSAKSTVSGIYSCWDDGSIKQNQYDGSVHVVEKDALNSGKCQFEMDRRVKEYNLIVVGSRANGIDGQIVQNMMTTPSGEDKKEMKLDIVLGNTAKGTGNGGITTVIRNESPIAQALGGITSNTSKLVHGNIESCKYISGSPCSSGEKPTCISKNTENYEPFKKSGKNPNKTNIVISCIKDGGIPNNDTSCQIDIDTMTYSESANSYSGSCIQNKSDGTTASFDVTVKITERDSSLKATPIGLSDSNFVKYLKMIPSNMQNGLTDTLLKYYQEGTDKNGVVLIMW